MPPLGVAPEPMRVLLATESYLPYLSGVTVSVDALARGLGAAGHEVLVLAPRPAGSGAPAGRLARAGAAHAWLPSYQLPAVAPPGYRMPVAAAAVRGAACGARLPARRRARPLAVRDRPARRAAGPRAGRAARLHAPHPLRRLRPLPRAAGRPRRAAATDAYLRALLGGLRGDRGAVGWTWRGEIRARLPARAPIGFTSSRPGSTSAASGRWRRSTRARAAGWPADALVVASLGRLAPEKSPELLLEALALAAAEAPTLRLLVIGGGPSEAASARAGARTRPGRARAS